MTAPSIWPFRDRLLRHVEKVIDDGKDPLVQLPTGGGKTVCVAELVADRASWRPIMVTALGIGRDR
jgi:superfamily II DNA or RNA helicase